MKIKTILSLLAIGAAAKLSAISYDANVNGLSAPSGASFSGYSSGNPRPLGLKTSEDGLWTILGVQGGSAGNEIGPNEALKVSFDKAMVLNSLTLGLLFDGPEYSDNPEIAVVTADGTWISYKLTVTGALTATYTNAASTVSNLSPALNKMGGVWEITKPFGGMAIIGFWLSADQSNVTPGSSTAEFGLQAFKAPDFSSTLAIFGASLLGLGVAFRSRR
ncbi:MAG: hypothetical protein SFV32_11805 [Opitutaceae bacterium]|nr:hypothetical protein [Opitutaceae bacterium]